MWRPEGGGWYLRDEGPVFWGLLGDVPVPGDYDGDGTTDIAVWRPEGGGWHRPDEPVSLWGRPTDVPLQLPYAAARTL